MELEEKKLMGARIREWRQDLGLSQEILAEKLGMKRTNVANYEAGRVVPPGNVLLDLSRIFNKSTDEILGRKEIDTIAAHHDNEEWTVEELEEIQRFKEFVKAKRDR